MHTYMIMKVTLGRGACESVPMDCVLSLCLSKEFSVPADSDQPISIGANGDLREP